MTSDLIMNELNYRKGYHQGFAQAVEDMLAFYEAGFSYDEAIRMCRAHAEALRTWRGQQPWEKMVLPPAIQIPHDEI